MSLETLKSRMQQAPDAEAAIRESADEMCKAFHADRVTVYRVTEDGASLSAVVQKNLEDFGSIRVRIDTGRSLAGYVGATRQLVNIADAYDNEELEPLHLQKKMFAAVDERTGYRTRQVLAAPVVAGGKLLGVVELLNRLDRKPFPKACEAEIVALCEAIAGAMAK